MHFLHHHIIFVILLALAVALSTMLRQTLIDYFVALKRRFSPIDVTASEVKAFMPAVIKKLVGSTPSTSGSPTADITCEGCSDAYRALLQPLVAALLAPAVGSCIIKHCHGAAHPVQDDGRFHLFIFSAASGEATEQAPDRYARRGETVKAFAPTGLGYPIMDEEGFFVAELVGKNLYWLTDPFATGNAREAEYFGRLLSRVKEIVLKEARGTSDQAKFEEPGFQSVMPQPSSCGRVYAGEFEARLRQLKTEQLQLIQVEAVSADAAGREFDQICKIAKVRKVKITRRKLIVKTGILYCAREGKHRLHEIGAFSIHIPLNGNGMVRWFNKTRLRYGNTFMAAPHVAWSGRACLGTIKYDLQELIESRELASVVELAIAFIESVNEHDAWGRGITKWPIAHRRRQGDPEPYDGAFLFDWSWRDKLAGAQVPFETTRSAYLRVAGRDLRAALVAIDCDALEKREKREGILLKLRPARKQPSVVATARARARYVKSFSGRINEALQSCRTVFRESSVRFREYQAQLFRQQRMEVRQVDESTRLATVKEEWQRLNEVAKVQKVRVIDGTILIDTETLFANSRRTGRRHEVGQFTIAISASCGRYGVRWFNRTRRSDSSIKGMNAVNVFADGTPVCDDILSTLLDLSVSGEFSVVADLAIQFIETVGDELEPYLINWPLAGEEKTHALA